MQKSSLLLWLAIAAGAVQAGPPPTEVFLASFAVVDGRVSIGTPANISNGPGYDNQPSFTPDGAAVLFTSVRGAAKADPANSAASGSDIYRYDIAGKKLIQVTSTAESEYSPTVMPGGSHLSVVRVEADGTQRLWQFSLDGTEPRLLFTDIKPVGYHAWIDSDSVALFVLGQPPTLQVARKSTGKAEVVATNIGRSLARIPWGGISYVQRESGSQARVMRLDPTDSSSTQLVTLLPEQEDADLAWTPDGMLLMAHAGRLYGWRRGDNAFRELADLDSLGLTGASRLAVSPQGDRIAIVARQQ